MEIYSFYLMPAANMYMIILFWNETANVYNAYVFIIICIIEVIILIVCMTEGVPLAVGPWPMGVLLAVWQWHDCGLCYLCRILLSIYAVSVSVTRLRCAKTAERIEVLFGMETLGRPRNTQLDGVPIPLQRGRREVV